LRQKGGIKGRCARRTAVQMSSQGMRECFENTMASTKLGRS